MLYLAGHAGEVDWIGGAGGEPGDVLHAVYGAVAARAHGDVFLHPERDPLGKGFHIMQSLIAVGTGGLHGLGLMEGRQKLYFLPEAWTDFIFANISEELGLLARWRWCLCL